MSKFSINDIKHEGEQEALRKAIGSISWEIKTLSEGIIWNSKNFKADICKIRVCLAKLEDLFSELD